MAKEDLCFVCTKFSELLTQMTIFPRRPRLSRVQFVASGLMVGGVFSICLPWLLSGFVEPKVERIPLAIIPTNYVARPKAVLPAENLQGEKAVRCSLELLRAGYEQLQTTRNFAAVFHKQERVDGILDEGSLIQVLSRHEPLSFYMKWLEGDAGRELLYVDGENDGEILVRLGGIRGRLLPVFRIDPDGETAREKTRHHISHMSLLNFTRTVIQHCEEDLNRLTELECKLIVDGPQSSEKWICVYTQYKKPGVAGEYRKTIHFIDRKTLLPLTVRTYRWPQAGQSISAEKLDGETLLEDYSYSDLHFNLPLTDADFRSDNPKYNFEKSK
ncbi:MAG: DUF1571 domain-containing protein [Planctomycetaceae bacterium]|nr:DUF1571 domain-containing protein [Planctomycetaceae bacterium]